ncbi:UDP-galactose-lipid carrier transferase [Euzebya pacifica]|uniref:UDP-galactose-lipid carrier transferase n=2 Tax=Euzebya pacifica TaxID=1608957 RepID=A0A346XZ65_9ACTN|nr:UDP-galactose-lipid carrier transferase [Euzebya pacifica]
MAAQRDDMMRGMDDTTAPPDLTELDLDDVVKAFRVDPGDDLDLSDHDTRATVGWDGDKEQGKAAALAANARLEALQELLYAEGKRRVLVVLQAMDTGGKDSTIRHVFDGVNPQGVKVASFKKPTEEELAHDYLWRAHAVVPADGQITVFNRSHYEDVLVVRVHDLVPEERWRKRYGHIRDFERLLADEGTTIVKIFLHISPEEQAERLQERLDNPEKHWKFATGDLAERKRWKDYIAAFEDALSETSTDHAPWYVIPADRKWYRNLVIANILVDVLEGLDMQWPPEEEGLDDVVIPLID